MNCYWQQGKKTKLRNAFNDNMSTDLKFSEAQISKIIQSGGVLRSLLSKLAGPLMKVAIPLAKEMLLQWLMQELKRKYMVLWQQL